MTRLRLRIAAHRAWVLAFLALTLAVRMVVPAGMMPGYAAGGATLIVCPGHMAMPGMAMPGSAMPGSAMPGTTMPAAKDDAGRHPPADVPCAFTDLLAAAIDGPALPMLAAVIVAVTCLPAAVLVAIAARTLRLRPPLRGPPPRAAA